MAQILITNSSSPSTSTDSGLDAVSSISETSVQGKPKCCAADELLLEERFWRDKQPWLLECGYRLRPRYAPDWTPSWWGTGKEWTECEDGVTNRAQSLNVMDAVRVSDGKFVALKKASKSRNPDEVDILDLFSSDPLANDPANHCVPMLDVLDIPNEENLLIIVMPLLRRHNNPWFSNIGEAVECIRQLFEGMQFMHNKRVAHRDAARPSFMMDASEMYPEGYHPRDIKKSRDYTKSAKHYSRTQKPPKYYFVGFGRAKVYADGPVVDKPVWGFDKTVPEFSASTSWLCDPFATDVYYLGHMLKEEFILTKKGFKFLDELVRDMTREDPGLRPTMDEVVSRFESIRQSMKNGKLQSRVAGRYDDVLTDLLEGVPHLARRAANSLRRSGSK